MDLSQTYQVNLEAFQGPMDLLLFLIRKKKIDIHDIPIAVITKEYLDYLDKMDQINIEREGEFLVIAALLIYIKSQMLLPREAVTEEGDDPRLVLVNRLLEYQKIKAASSLLREKEDQEIQRWHRSISPPLPEGETEEVELTEVSLFDLAEVFFDLIKKREQGDIHVISSKEFSVEEKMKEIVTLLQEKGFLDFLEFFETQNSLEEALASFFCLLELVKNKIVVALQENLFEPIKVWLRKESKA
ncbi:segregation and condensation protein A [Acidobacteriota bacterium]